MEVNSSNSSALASTYPQDSVAELVTKALACTAVTLAAIIGNLLTIIAVNRNLRMRTVTNFLICNLALAELLFTVVAIPPFYFEIFAWYDWLQAASHCASDAAEILIKDLAHFTWSISGAVAAPVLYSYRLNKAEGIISCQEDWTPVFETDVASKGDTIVLFVFIYCLPFVAMATMPAIIGWRLWVHKAPGEMSSVNTRVLLKTKQKAVKMLLAVLIAFIICWLPVQVVSFLSYYTSKRIPSAVWFTCLFVMRAHAALTPFIYDYFSANFRAAFKSALVFCCLWSNTLRQWRDGRVQTSS
ncbi:predicted protein [Nematostella vectensis]|uniref:G-protein coupled receptors family 1 profile domain-containing protein n=1 Tax=Nematostella vectensis TaxID=45351 RepID=A7T1A7_NEMVE|nr:predicted protein [Nematostella vectensis]|eukprot:XP_001622358.1 hypothetical protein NEMVEDRAFT_v1g220833 [Nematostella vectensis]